MDLPERFRQSHCEGLDTSLDPRVRLISPSACAAVPEYRFRGGFTAAGLVEGVDFSGGEEVFGFGLC
jgi:hypothetical protein